ncbi:MAG: DUF4340 domain-containing protein [Bdellovibrionota bacterium]
MKAKSLLIIAFLSLIMGLYVYFEIERPHENQDEIALEKRLIQPDFKLLEKVELQIPGQEKITFRLDDNSKKVFIDAPFSDLGSSSKFENFLSSLAKLQRKKLIFSKDELDANKLPAFKLKTPESLQVNLFFKGQESPTELFFGGPNPQRDSVYVLLEPESSVFLTSNDMDVFRTDRPSDYREKRLTTVEAPKFSEIIIENKSGRMKFVRENESWKMIQPKELPIDSAFADSQLAKLALVRANDFLKTPPKELAQPEVRVRIGFQEGIQDSRTNEKDPRPYGTHIDFARRAKKEKIEGDPEDQFDYFASSEKVGPVSISRFHFDNFTKSYKDFVKKTFDDFILEDVSEVEISQNDQKWKIKKENENFVEQTLGLISQERLNQALSSIRSMKAEAFEDEQSAPAKLDLQIKLKLKSGEERIYSLLEEKNRSLWWLQTPSSSLKYSLKKNSLDPKLWNVSLWNQKDKSPTTSNEATDGPKM